MCVFPLFFKDDDTPARPAATVIISNLSYFRIKKKTRLD